MELKKKPKINIHPNSLKNLRPHTLTDEDRKKAHHARQVQKGERGQFKQLMDGIYKRAAGIPDHREDKLTGGSFYNHKLLNLEPKKFQTMFKDYLSKKLNEMAGENKTFKEKIIDRMINLLLSRDTSNSDFLKSLDMALEMTGEKQKDKTIVLQQTNTQNNEVDIEKLKELKELLNGDKKQS